MHLLSTPDDTATGDLARCGLHMSSAADEAAAGAVARTRPIWLASTYAAPASSSKSSSSSCGYSSSSISSCLFPPSVSICSSAEGPVPLSYTNTYTPHSHARAHTHSVQHTANQSKYLTSQSIETPTNNFTNSYQNLLSLSDPLPSPMPPLTHLRFEAGLLCTSTTPALETRGEVAGRLCVTASTVTLTAAEPAAE